MADQTYLWENFVHFSSAKERVDNFVYKVQLIELYESAVIKATTDYTSGGGAYYTGSLSSIQEAEWQQSKKDEIVNGFDGFEKYLYNENDNTTNTATSATWPYNSGVRMSSTSSVVLDWYENVSTSASEYDKENRNYVLNNIPSFILRNSENENFLLFLCLIGQHFDNIYYHTEAIDRTRKLGYESKDNIANKLLYYELKSLGWDSKNMSADMALLEYVLGQDANGTVRENTPAKQRTYEIWRRILNNLPYLLKHKGSRRAIEGLLACYGIPSSILSVIEFGGPNTNNGSTAGSTTTTNSGTKDNTNTSTTNVFEYTTTSTAIHLTNSASIEVDWSRTNQNDYPTTVEIFTQPAYATQSTLISASQWSVELSGSKDSKFGKVIMKSGSSNLITSSLVPIFNGNYFGILLNKTTGSTATTFELNVAQVDKGRIIYSSSVTASVATSSAVFWNSGSKLSIGGGTYNYSGSVDEFRLWSKPLNTNRFIEHVSFPEMINGNHVSSSTEDLHLRLDFEYPKDLSTKTTLINVDPNIYFSGSITRNQLEDTITPVKNSNILSDNVSASFSASLRNFPSVATYPYNFVPIERNVSLKTPDLGVTRYSNNKVRFQEKSLNGNLSATQKATDSASDISPIDSNRVGLFFSPTKELNIDIAKSIGGENLDNYIGDPSDSYKESYKDLKALRGYYFKRFDRKNIYEYINLVKTYEKSVFETVKKLMPAKAKVTTGILIEPHVLERSKVKKKKPSGDSYQNDGQVDTTGHILVESENYQLETTLPKITEFTFVAEDYQLETTIDNIIPTTYDAESYQLDTLIEADNIFTTTAESYQNETTIDAKYNEASISSIVEFLGTRVGQSTLEEIGFGLYCQNGHAIRTYYDAKGLLAKQRVLVNLITEKTTFDSYKYATVVNGLGDPRGGYILTSSVLTNNILNIQPYTGSNGSVSTAPTVTGNIIAVTPVNGYLRTHFKYTSDLSTGLNNSFYKGCKNTDATTYDGYPVVQTFTTNPNTLVVSKAGRPASEPILEVE